MYNNYKWTKRIADREACLEWWTPINLPKPSPLLNQLTHLDKPFRVKPKRLHLAYSQLSPRLSNPLNRLKQINSKITKTNNNSEDNKMQMPSEAEVEEEVAEAFKVAAGVGLNRNSSSNSHSNISNKCLSNQQKF